MALLREHDRRHLMDLFARQLEAPVTIRFFTQRASPLIVPAQECATCRETGELLEEVQALSEKITLEVHDLVADVEEARRFGVDKIPALVFQGKNRGVVRYFGVPAGYEFSVLVEDLVDISRGTTRLSSATREALANLPGPAHIKVLVTPTCPYCPQTARLAHQMAIESPMVTADVIEVSEFPEVAQRYRVYGVPKVIINDRVTFEGALPEGRFLDKVIEAVPRATRA